MKGMAIPHGAVLCSRLVRADVVGTVKRAMDPPETSLPGRASLVMLSMWHGTVVAPPWSCPHSRRVHRPALCFCPMVTP